MAQTDNLTDRDFLVALAGQVETLIEQCNDMTKQLDHIDVQVHEISQFIEEHRPALARGLALMGGGLGGWIGKRGKSGD